MLTKEQGTKEMDYRLAETIFLQMTTAGMMSIEEYEVLRDRLIDELDPVIGAVERGIPYAFRINLKERSTDDREKNR